MRDTQTTPGAAEAQLRELEELLARTRRVRQTIEALRKATGARAQRPPRRAAPSGQHPQGRPRGSGRGAG